MFEQKNGWKQPEEKYPEPELEDSFAGFFSEEEEETAASEGKKHRRKKKTGPDILAVAEPEEDSGFIIEEVLVPGAETKTENESKASVPEEKPIEHAEEPDEHDDALAEHGEEEQAEKAEPEAESETETKVETVPAPAPVKKKKTLFPRAKKIIDSKRKHKSAAVIGAALIALALVGAIVLVSLLIHFGIRLADNTKQKEAFEWKIYPLLMLDPATFDDPSQLDDVFLLKTALWSTLLEHRTTYGYNENGLLIVPASDLDVAAKKLYGDAVTLKHQTFSEGYEFFYIYDSETNTYQVPVSGQTAGYTPKVIKIAKDGDRYTLIVGYVAPTTLWMMSEDGSSSESVPDKYLYYDLQKVSRDNYVIKSVRNIPIDELPDDLEVASQQSLNQTQYFDYDALYQDYLDSTKDQVKDNVAYEEIPEETTPAEEPTEEPQEEPTE